MRWLGLASIAPLLAGCLFSNPLRNTRCEPISAEVTGELAQDIAGTFGDFGLDSPVYYVFEAGGGWRWVEAPNMYAPNGLSGAGRWALGDGGVVTITYDDGFVSELGGVAVDADEMVVARDLDTGDLWETSHPRVACEGWGFE